MKFLVTTPLEKEFVVTSLIKEKFSDLIEKIETRPFGFFGVLIVEGKKELGEKLLEIPEIEKVFPIEIETKFENVNDLIEIAKKLSEKIREGSKIAIRVNKRGIYDWKSIEIEKLIADEILKQKAFQIDFKNPEKIIDLEIFPKNWVGGCVLDGSVFYKKYEGKPDSFKIIKKLTIAQLVYYTENETIAKKMGEELGRAAQAFEVPELVFLIDKPINIRILWKFLKSADYGAFSRYKQQEKAYEREVIRTKIFVYELYEYIRSLNPKKTLIIITDPRGKPIEEVREKLKKDIEFAEKIVVFNGSDHGIPTGCFRFADYVLDLAPKIVFATEQTITACIIALLNL